MRIILDSNIWISFLIGHQIQTVRRILTDARVDVYVCDYLIAEIVDVANREKIRKYIKDNELEDLLRIISSYCKNVPIKTKAGSAVRDPKDLYLISLAETVDADYIVSGDLDLLELKKYKNTKMIKLAEFKSIIL